MQTITVTIPGEPRGKGRPRFSRHGAFVKTYTPESTALYENLVRVSYIQQNPGVRLSGAIRAEIAAYFSIPASTSKKKRELMVERMLHCTKKPDADNLAKCILDALNSIAYIDDKQIAELVVTKLYSEEPRVEVTLTELEEGR